MMSSASSPRQGSPFGAAVVGVWPSHAVDEHAQLLKLLEFMFPIRFVAGIIPECVAVLLLGENDKLSSEAPENDLPNFCLRADCEFESVEPKKVIFEQSPPGQSYLGGVDLEIRQNLRFPVVKPLENERIIMTASGRPLWVEGVTQSGQRLTVAGGLPRVSSGKVTILNLIKNRWLLFVPLIDFVYTVSEPFDWDRVPPRACIMFDDPNLHWRTWGYINFEQLATHASQHNYHASMAMVPIDTWGTHSSSAKLFREHPQSLSLLVHGVHHTPAELAYDIPNDSRRGYLSDGIRRLEKFERHSGCSVSRVMAPPHHACSVDAASLMLEAGFEAACVSFDAFMKWNDKVEWQDGFGLGASEFVGEGLPVIPRSNFESKEYSLIFLAALLRQPIVMIGHHWDLKEGLEPLAELAAVINRIPSVQWGNMGDVVRGCWSRKRVGKELSVLMSSRCVEILIPSGVEKIQISRPWTVLDSPDKVQFERGRSAGDWGAASIEEIPSGESRIDVRDCHSVRLSSFPAQKFPLAVPVSPPIRAYLRRVACEMRDRAMPYIDKVNRR